MFLLYRLIKAFTNGEISIDYFSSEFSLVYSRYDGLYELEMKEFNIKFNPEINVLYDKLNDLCSRYYSGITDAENKKYGCTTTDQLTVESYNIYKMITEKKLLSIN